MKTTAISLVFAAGLVTAGASAAETAVAPTIPPPTGTIAVQAAPDQIVYAQQLPGIVELTKVAAAQNLAVRQITKSANEVTITCQLADGQTKTVSYRLLANAGSNPVQVVSPAPVPAVPVGTCYYCDSIYPYGYPFAYGYPSVSIRLGGGFHRWRHR
jgi:hypothetical protein